MKKKEKKFIYLILFFAIFFHIVCINFYPINFEFIFFEASDFIREGFKKEIARQFFDIQANTFFFSFVISFFSFIFPFIEPIYIGKIISLLSFLFITLAALNFYEKKVSSNENNFFNISYFLIFLILNPLIWVFGYRSTPDVISMSMALYGFSIIYKYHKNNNYLYFAALLLGFATTLKIITSIYLIAGMMLFKLSYYKNNFFSCLIIAIFYSIIPLIYFSITYYNFNFFLFSPYYKTALAIVNSPLVFLNNLILYSSFLFIFSCPILVGSIILTIKNFSIKRKLINLGIYLIIFYLGSKNVISSIEMNFGFFSSYFNENILSGLLYCSAYTLSFLLYFEIRKQFFLKNFLKVKLIIVVIIYLLIISSSLASQRYLIVILPLFYFLFKSHIKLCFKFNLLFLLIFCIPVNFLLITNQYLTGSVSNKMVEYIRENGLINKTCAGSIAAHVSHYFPVLNRNPSICGMKDYHVVTSNEQLSNDIYSVSEKFFFLKKELHLRKVR